MTVDADVMDKSSNQHVNNDIATIRYTEDPTLVNICNLVQTTKRVSNTDNFMAKIHKQKKNNIRPTSLHNNI